MDTLLQQLINGITLGAVYALVALGYTMVYGIIGLINFAHGEVVMIGTMVAFTVIVSLAAAGVPPMAALTIALLVSVVVCMILDWALERVAYRPLRHAPRLTPLITAIGMSIVLQNVAMIIWGRNYITFPPMIDKRIYEFGGATFTNVQIAIVTMAALMMIGLIFLVHRTKIGMAMRATAQNPHVVLVSQRVDVPLPIVLRPSGSSENLMCRARVDHALLARGTFQQRRQYDRPRGQVDPGR